jgi:hypothetical protein
MTNDPKDGTCCEMVVLLKSSPIFSGTGLADQCFLCENCGRWTCWRLAISDMTRALLLSAGRVPERPHTRYPFVKLARWRAYEENLVSRGEMTKKVR